jgi:hypothetical protein
MPSDITLGRGAGGLSGLRLVYLGTGDDGDGHVIPYYGLAVTQSGNVVLGPGESFIGKTGGSKISSTVSFAHQANATPYSAKDTIGPAELTVSGATNATPIVLTTGTHGLADGDPVTVASVGGNTAANGVFFAKVTGYSSTTFGLYSDRALTTAVAGNGAYTSGGTVVKNPYLSGMGRILGGKGYLVKNLFMSDQTTLTETLRIHFFNQPVAYPLDNAQYPGPLFADLSKFIGTVDLPAARVEGTGATASYACATPNTSNSQLPLSFTCHSLDDRLYLVFETPNGLIPASGQMFALRATAEQD